MQVRHQTISKFEERYAIQQREDDECNKSIQHNVLITAVIDLSAPEAMTSERLSKGASFLQLPSDCPSQVSTKQSYNSQQSALLTLQNQHKLTLVGCTRA